MRTTRIKSTSIVSALLAMLIFIPFTTQAQEETTSEEVVVEKVEEAKPEKDRTPIRPGWNAGMLIETQTDLVWDPGTLEMVMQHRFGLLNADNGFDLAGIYGASNIRMGVNYGIFKNAQIGFGTQKNNMIQDLNWKYKILSQTKSNSMPIALTYYGNVQVDARDKSFFGAEYAFTDRMAYFHQLIISRKFSNKLSLQVTGNYAHHNQLNSATYPTLKHDNFGFGFAGRYKVTSTMCILFEYDQALTTPGAYKWLEEENNPALAQDEVGLRNVSLGIEIATSSHAFHFFVTTYSGISYQDNMVYNTNYFTSGAVLLGFNITRNWNF